MLRQLVEASAVAGWARGLPFDTSRKATMTRAAANLPVLLVVRVRSVSVVRWSFMRS